MWRSWHSDSMPVVPPLSRVQFYIGARRVDAIFTRRFPRSWQLRLLAGCIRGVVVHDVGSGVPDLEWLAPLAPTLRRLRLVDFVEDIGAVATMTSLEDLAVQYAPSRGGQGLRDHHLRRYEGPWFNGLGPALSSPSLVEVELRQPPRELAKWLTAPLQRLRLLGARKLAAVPGLECRTTLRDLEIAGGRELDLAPLAQYTALEELVIYGRTPLTGMAVLRQCPALRRLELEECYAFDDIAALEDLPLTTLHVIGRAESLGSDVLDRLRRLPIQELRTPQP